MKLIKIIAKANVNYIFLFVKKKWIELTNIETIFQKELMKNMFLMILFTIDTFRNT